MKLMCCRALIGVCLLALVFSSGCSTSRFRAKADKEVYGIIQQKSAAVPNMEEDFTIDSAEEEAPLDGLPRNTEVDETLGPGGENEVDAYVLDLESALEVAVTHSRTYQNNKEQLYLTALGLTLERHRYDPIFGGTVNADVAHDTVDVVSESDFSRVVGGAGQLIQSVEALTGTPANLLTDYAAIVSRAGALGGVDATQTDIVNERSVGGTTSLGVSKLMRGGGLFALNLTSNFLRFLTGDPRVATSSILTGSFTQPLLRGAGSKIAAEQLTQAERNTLYELRDFTQFRKDFIVQVTTQYYNVLQNRDIVRNNWMSYQDFQKNVERMRSMAAEGRITQSDLGRLEQEELNSRNNWVNARSRYNASLDQFKLTLGLSTNTNLILDDADLVELREAGLDHPEITADEAIEVALAARLDLYNSRDQVDDAERKLEVAANSLLPDLNLVIAGDVSSTGQDRFQELDFRRAAWSAGFDLELPLDRKSERNNYRSALIAYERAVRDHDLAEDTVKLDLRATWRNLEQARQNYDVAVKSVELSRQRVEEQDLLAELGRATAQDQVDARNDLTQAQNALTAALVSHTIARLTFWRDMGILYIKKDGRWEEIDNDYRG